MEKDLKELKEKTQEHPTHVAQLFTMTSADPLSHVMSQSSLKSIDIMWKLNPDVRTITLTKISNYTWKQRRLNIEQNTNKCTIANPVKS